jgi:polysaccharide export outer membrane protein
MIRLVSVLRVAILLPGLLFGQTVADQLFQPRQTEIQQTPLPDVTPSDCIDCGSDGDNSPRQAKSDMDTPSGSSATPPSAKAQPLAPAAVNPSHGTDRTPGTSSQLVSEPETEFQRFVQSSTGTLLPNFGAALFEHVPSTFAPTDRVPTKADYVLGPGDQIEVRLWGQVNFTENCTVDTAGDIFLPRAGRISVSGVPFAQLLDIIRSSLGRVYRNFDLNVSMGQMRSMQIFVLGQARRPGTYTVSSLSTLVNALFVSGGPSSRGSLRNIQLKRGHTVVTTFDLYDLLLQGDKTKDAPLLSGDIIFIPEAGPRVAIEGSVASPAIFELKQDTTLGDAVNYAGGISSTADGQRAIVERIDKHSVLHSEDIGLTTSGLASHPLDGDIIRILSVVPRFVQTVSLRGNVADPVRKRWHIGMKVSDLIPNRESLLTRGYWHQHNQLLGSGTAGQPMAPDIDWRYATIERLNLQSLATEVIAFDLGKLVIDHDPSADVVLEPNDIVTVFSVADISVPNAQQTKYVRIEGEVKLAGAYSVRPGETLRDVVVRAGGLTPQAYLFGALFTRESTRKEQQRRYTEFLDQMETEINQSSAALGSRVAPSEQAGSVQATIAAERAQIARLRRTGATGRIVLDVEPNSQGVDAIPGLPLENGDRFFVPNTPASVNVVGMVYNQATFLYGSDLRLIDYLQDAGGPLRYADRAREFVIRADGSVISREMRSRLFSGTFDSLRIYPGDTLVMPGNVSRTTLLRGLLDWSQVIANFGLGAAAVNVLK